MDCLIRFVQMHESFRKPEIEALATYHNIDLEWIHYDEKSPFSIVRLPSAAAARLLVSRSILSKSIHELYAHGPDLSTIYASLSLKFPNAGTTKACPDQDTPSAPFSPQTTFRIDFDIFASSLPLSARNPLLTDLMAHLSLYENPISLSHPDETFTLFTENTTLQTPSPHTPASPPSSLASPPSPHIYFGRLISAQTSRPLLSTYTLKTRPYINTTSMDAELSLLTANLACIGPGKLVYDPFLGTGGLVLAGAAMGAGGVWGSDIDGRVIRGEGGEGRAVKAGEGKEGGGSVIKGAKGGRQSKGTKAKAELEPGEAEHKRKEKKDVVTNFEFYGLDGRWMDGFVSDLTNTPMVQRRVLDAVVCDPPYGVREGLKVLGSEKERLREVVWLEGGRGPAHLQPNYIPPKRAYSLSALLDDILDFAVTRLVDSGRLCVWMPTASAADTPQPNPTPTPTPSNNSPSASSSEEIADLPIPQHECLVLESCCVQPFNKWSRRLLTYSRVPGVEAPARRKEEGGGMGGTANELNGFRRRYFEGFK